MVNKLLILKHINDAIIKCSRNTIKSNGISWGVRFNNAVRKALDTFREKTCTMGEQLSFEKVEILDNNGDIVYSNSDYKEGSVTYDSRLIGTYREAIGHELHMTHNHPNGFYRIPTCLSEADAKVLLNIDDRYNNYLFKSITAETPNGSRMTLMKNNNFNIDNHADFREAYSHLNKTHLDYLNDFASKKVELMGDTDRIVKGFVEKYPNTDRNNREKLLQDYINERVIDEIGTLEDRLSDVRHEFNECNVEFSIEWLQKGGVI